MTSSALFLPKRSHCIPALDRSPPQAAVRTRESSQPLLLSLSQTRNVINVVNYVVFGSRLPSAVATETRMQQRFGIE